MFSPRYMTSAHLHLAWWLLPRSGTCHSEMEFKLAIHGYITKRQGQGFPKRWNYSSDLQNHLYMHATMHDYEHFKSWVVIDTCIFASGITPGGRMKTRQCDLLTEVWCKHLSPILPVALHGQQKTGQKSFSVTWMWPKPEGLVPSFLPSLQARNPSW